MSFPFLHCLLSTLLIHVCLLQCEYSDFSSTFSIVFCGVHTLHCSHLLSQRTLRLHITPFSHNEQPHICPLTDLHVNFSQQDSLSWTIDVLNFTRYCQTAFKMYTLSKDLLSANHMPGTILATGVLAVNKVPAFSDLIVGCGRQQ